MVHHLLFHITGNEIWFELIVWLIILVGATSLVLSRFSLSSYGGLIGFLASRIFMFIMFNIIICSILVKNYRPSAECYSDYNVPSGDLYHEAEEEQSEEVSNDDTESSSDSSSDSDDDSYYFNSDGYEEDDDDDSDCNDENGWDNDDEEYDDTLESRIEEFIAKVIRGWKEEQLADRLDSEQVDEIL